MMMLNLSFKLNQLLVFNGQNVLLDIPETIESRGDLVRLILGTVDTQNQFTSHEMEKLIADDDNFMLRPCMFIMQENGMYAHPTRKTFEHLASMLQGKKVVEVAAGRGYITHNLKKLGVDIKATDDMSWAIQNQFTEVEQRSALDSIEADVDVYIASWIPYESTWDVDFLNKMRETNPNAVLICIGETYGCTNLEEFWYEAERVEIEGIEKLKELYYEDTFFGDTIAAFK